MPPGGYLLDEDFYIGSNQQSHWHADGTVTPSQPRTNAQWTALLNYINTFMGISNCGVRCVSRPMHLFLLSRIGSSRGSDVVRTWKVPVGPETIRCISEPPLGCGCFEPSASPGYQA